MNPFTVNLRNRSLSFIHKYTDVSNDVTVININSLKDVCFHVKTGNLNYVSEPVNVFEFE